MASDSADRSPDPKASTPTVLVVEDEAFIRFHIADTLRDCGFRVLEAADGTQALDMLDGDKQVDLVFTDVTLAGELDGFELAQRLRARKPRLPVILTSGRHNEAAAREICREEPFLAKPYDMSELVARIKTLLGPSESVGPSD